MAKVKSGFGDRIKKLSEQLHLTKEAMADTVGVRFATVNKWENGWTVPSKLALRRIDQLCNEHSLSPIVSSKKPIR
jgi:DNA-binding transcriptional regulator YiaG